jgi:hypothetical protein
MFGYRNVLLYRIGNRHYYYMGVCVGAFAAVAEASVAVAAKTASIWLEHPWTAMRLLVVMLL